MLRTALFLSVVLDRPFRMRRIRAGRESPGLKPQHVAVLRLVADMTGAEVSPFEVGTPEVTFRPRAPKAGTYRADIGTAGCLPLLLQAALPVAIAAGGRTRIEASGGTHVPFGPTVDWMQASYLPYLAPLAAVELAVGRVGFAPQGGGRIAVEIEAPSGFRDAVKERLGARRIQQGHVARLAIRSLAAHVGRDVPKRQAFAALAELGTLGMPAVETVQVEADGPGSAVTCSLVDDLGNLLASDRLGARGTPAERVGQVAGRNLVEDWKSGATVDRHLADHVVPWVALGAGAVRVPHATPHLESNAWVCNQFLGHGTVRTDRNLVR